MRAEQIAYTGRLAPGFTERYAMQQSILARLRMQGETDFPTAKGDYGSVPAYVTLDLPRTRTDKTPVSALTGAELLYEERIRQYLSDSSQEPIVVLDLGGMAGLSWCRLATRFADEVDVGRVVFVVTSISFRPELDLSRIKKLTAEESRFIEDAAHRIHYINAQAAQLPLMTVSSPVGAIPLRSHVDIVNEVASVTKHSFIPEYDLLHSIPLLLSPRGSYFVHDANPGIYFESSTSEFYQRQEGIRIARDDFVHDGLILTHIIEEGKKKGESLDFSVFRKKEAPPIRFDA